MSEFFSFIFLQNGSSQIRHAKDQRPWPRLTNNFSVQSMTVVGNIFWLDVSHNNICPVI